MNVTLLRKIQEQIVAEPRRFDMVNWATEQCGTTCCIAGWAVAIEAAERRMPWNADYVERCCNHTDTPLDITDEQFSRLVYVGEWPTAFRRAYEMHEDDAKVRAEVAYARIEFFIKTNGTDQETPKHAAPRSKTGSDREASEAVRVRRDW